MSTRSMITCKGDPKNNEPDVTIYRHWDGYPMAVIPDLIKVLDYAWELPRYEPSDFAAAICAAWKHKGGGDIYIVRDADALGGIEYYYTIKQEEDGKLTVSFEFDDEKEYTITISKDMTWVDPEENEDED